MKEEGIDLPFIEGERDCSGDGNILCEYCWGLLVHGCPCPPESVTMCDCEKETNRGTGEDPPLLVAADVKTA